ncbi:DDE family endonuclease [Rhizoctonia solani 123E]|uniref:DDE family endonuclease n=1 Tax=Rhizoctonia solani 123E TaxID=1423351 RepID=A0A074RGL9_9AGAM|nr:DDE family endonuclease [Rhizoctonia solani 123E]
MNHQLKRQFEAENDDFLLRMLLDDDEEDIYMLQRWWRRRQQQRVQDQVRRNQKPPRERWNYLKRGDLLPNPRDLSSWLGIYNSREDRAYLKVLGVNVPTFDFLLNSGFAEAWNTRPIARTDTNSHGATRIGGRSLDAAGGLGLLLYYLCNTMDECGLQVIFAIIPSTVSRYISFAMGIMLEILQRLPVARIEWPDEDLMAEYSNLITNKHSHAEYLDGAFGFMDGLNLPVQTPNDQEEQEPFFNGWLHAHIVGNVLIFAPDGTIIAARINTPGSWHDSRRALPLYDLIRDTPTGFFIIADSAFPKLTVTYKVTNEEGNEEEQEDQKIKVPLKGGARVRGTAEYIDRVTQESKEVTSARQAVEWGMRAIQGCFSRLYVPLDVNRSDQRANLLEVCFRLHNVRTRMIGINQITSVYVGALPGIHGNNRPLPCQIYPSRAHLIAHIQHFQNGLRH